MEHPEASRRTGPERRWIELAPWPIHLLDIRGRPQRPNPELAALLGYGVDELDQSTLFEALTPESRTRLAECRHPSTTDRPFVELKLVYRHRTDIEIEARNARVGPLDDDQTPPLVMLSDVAPSRRLRRADIQSRFARLIAHDLNNVFTIAQSYVDLAHRQSPSARLAIEYLERAANAIQRGIRTSKQLQTLALDKGFPIEESDVGDAVRHLQTFLPRLLPTGPRWSFDCASSLPTVMSHPALLSRFALDFAINGHRRWPHARRLELNVRHSPGEQPAVLLRIEPADETIAAGLPIPFRLFLCRPDPFSPAQTEPLFVSGIIDDERISIDATDDALTALIPAHP